MKFTSLPEFNKDLKRLLRKYQTLKSDLEVIKKFLALYPLGRGNIDQIPGLGIESKIFKARLMCRAVKGSSFRLIYCYDEKTLSIIFIELYFKGDKAVEDRKRIITNFE